jgi:CheY-like chemotaxis protein
MAKILLVEDDKSLREIYGVRLQAEGYTIISAGDGEEALAVAIKERPDLIVSDVMMPKISGFDMLDILRSTTETKDIKVIMMTALSSEDQRARGEALGADRYLVKSQVGIEDVVRTVHDVLADGLPGTAPAAPAPVAAPAPIAPITPEPVAAPVAPAPVAEIPVPTFEATPIVPTAMPAPLEAPAPMVAPIEPLSPAPAVEAPAFAPMPAPVAPVAPIAPAFTPAPEPVVAPVTPSPAPVTFPPSVTLPEPTAPFSSNPPAGLGDRIINPLPSADSLNATGVTDIAAQMNQELNAHLQGLEQPAAPVAPAPAPAQYAVPPQPQAPQIPPLPPQPGI